VTEDFYRRTRSELTELYETAGKQTSSGGNWYKTKVRYLGKGYVRRVAAAQRDALIDTYTAATYLDAKVQQLPRLAREAQVLELV
jgi:hypothetical protein